MRVAVVFRAAQLLSDQSAEMGSIVCGCLCYIGRERERWGLNLEAPNRGHWWLCALGDLALYLKSARGMLWTL